MEIKITKDIRKYKTKDVGNFSWKEVAWIVTACGVAGLCYFATKMTELSFFLLVIVILFGFMKPFGLTCFQFFRMAVKNLLVPQSYLWETDFEYEVEESVTKDESLIQSEDEPVRYTKEENNEILR